MENLVESAATMLSLHVNKVKKLNVDLRRGTLGDDAPVCIDGAEVERVGSIKLDELSWTQQMVSSKKA